MYVVGARFTYPPAAVVVPTEVRPEAVHAAADPAQSPRASPTTQPLASHAVASMAVHSLPAWGGEG